MKNYILFCFFGFHLAAYAQCNTIPNTNFENKLILLVNTKSIQDDQMKILAFTATILGAKNESHPINNRQFANSFVINPLYYLRTPIKKLNVSQSMDVDYFVFSRQQLVFVKTQKKIINNCYSIYGTIKSNKIIC